MNMESMHNNPISFVSAFHFFDDVLDFKTSRDHTDELHETFARIIVCEKNGAMRLQVFSKKSNQRHNEFFIIDKF